MVFLVAPPYRYVAPTYLFCFPLLRKLPGVCTQNFHSGRGVYSQRSNVQPSNFQTILSSHCSRTPLVPQLATTLGIFTIRGNNTAPPGV